MIEISLLAQTTKEEVANLVRTIDMHEIEYSNYTCYNKADVSFPAITYLTAKDVADIKSYIILNSEVSHIDETKAEIVELCAIKVVDGKAVSIFHTLVKPTTKIEQPFADFINISNLDVEEAPSLSQIKESFFDFIGDLTICGYNINGVLKLLYRSGFVEIIDREFVEIFAFMEATYPKFQRFMPFSKVCELMRIDVSSIKASRTFIDCVSGYFIFTKELWLAQQSAKTEFGN